MHLFERYSLASGAKISKPIVPTSFYPLEFDKYITFNAASTNMPAKFYSLSQEVLNVISGELDKKGIKIIQLGAAEEPQYQGVIRLNGQTTIPQSAHIVKNALLHLGVDSMLSHIASSFDIPLVTLFSVSPPSACGPYWGEKSRQVCLEPHFPAGELFSYNPNSSHVNTIRIEEVVEAIGKLLDIDTFTQISTLFVGSNYLQNIIEVIPDSNQAPQLQSGLVPMIRYDLGGAEQAAFGHLQLRKSGLYTDKPMNREVLTALKGNIERLIYELKEEWSLDFVKWLYSSGIPYLLATDLPEEKANLIKLEISEYSILHNKSKGRRPEKLVISDNTFYKTNKIIFSGGQIYLSHEHLKQLIASDGSNIGKIIDNDSFFEEMAEFCFIYDKIA